MQFTPSGADDDAFIIQFAFNSDGFIVSNDNYREFKANAQASPPPPLSARALSLSLSLSRTLSRPGKLSPTLSNRPLSSQFGAMKTVKASA